MHEYHTGPVRGDTSPILHNTEGQKTDQIDAELVGCAHYILGPFGQDSDLKRHGEKIAQRGGKNASKRAIVAVARKLAALLHRL
jgi:hypothetical protein